ncbi:MAG: hypothetical protein IJ123_03740 [Blautia sp.]|nr:hypothetical protein [Blautia sp.]
MEYWINIILLFFIYAFAGWCMEVILKYRQYHRFINRGFLNGPLCPIYGCGAVLITVVIGNLAGVESGIVMTFTLSFVICGVVEYFTGLILEKIFHARWWDYSQKPMNLHGRVWIGNLLLFGVAGVGIMHILNPVLYKFLGLFTVKTRAVVSGILLAVLAVDFVVSYFVLKLVKVGVDSSEADNTEEINKEVHQLMTDKSYFHKRFVEAYPEVVYRTERVQARLDAVKAENERLRREAERRVAAAKAESERRRQEAGKHLEAQAEKVAQSLEPVHRIRADLIGKQDELIALLYNEETASEEARKLKAEVDRQKGRLENHAFVRNPYGKNR